MKKFLSFILALACLFGLVGCINNDPNVAEAENPAPASSVGKIDTNGLSVSFYASNNGYMYQVAGDGETSLFYIKGVNMGLSEADTDLANPNTDYATYYEWFTLISEMNANTVRVFSVMNPNFYNALFDFNEDADNPIYLVQGIWFSEDLLELSDALEGDRIILDAFERSVRETVDIIHGNSDYTSYGEFNPAVYKKDVSKYVVGYILGLEYAADFVIETNASHPSEKTWDGDFIKTVEDSAPFESFLCRVGDTLISYETNNYSSQTPVSFLNWQTLDTLSHSNEPFKDEEDSASVNTENIKAESSYIAGLFAAVDAYPYYPEFMNHQSEYVNDKSGDNYLAYLKDLQKEYTVPLLIAEYGLSTSRGVAHGGINGYQQGGITEDEQGRLDAQMTRDVYKSGCCGGLLFSWQDEWFKRTWNTVMYYPENPTQRTQNLSSAEQGYGLLQYVPSGIYPDGEVGDWSGVAPLCKNVTVQWDSSYLHILVSLAEDYDFESDVSFIPISVNGAGSDFSKEYNLSFSKEADFLVVINGKDNTRVLCDAYNDVFHYKYAYLRGVFGESEKFTYEKGSGKYNKIYQYTANEMYLPDDGITIEPQYYEDGLLKYGNGNPDGKNYLSNADFFYKDSKLEIRLPWYLIGVMNPITKACIAPLEDDEVSFTAFDGIMLGYGREGEIELYDVDFNPPEKSYKSTRLKNSYYIIKDCFAELIK